SFNVANVLFFDASGGAGVYTGNTDSAKNGLALALAVSVRADVNIASLEASGTLIVNTTSIDRVLGTVNLAANTFMLDVTGKIQVLEVIKVEASFRIVISQEDGQEFWLIDIDLSLDFFGIARLSGDFYLDSTGIFRLNVAGYVSLGGGGTGLFGNFTFHLSNDFLRDVNDTDMDGDTTEIMRDGSGNAFYRFELSGSANVSAKLFGITLASFGLDFSFAAEGQGATPITLTVKVRIKILFVKITKTARFKIGTLQLPKPIYLAGLETAPQGYTPVDSGRELVLNVGDRRDSRNIGNTPALVDDPKTEDDERKGYLDEAYVIRDLGPSERGVGRIINITAYGRSNTFQNVTSIKGDFGKGNDAVVFGDVSVGGVDEAGNVIIPGPNAPASAVSKVPTIPVIIDMGEGDDAVSFSGTAVGSVINLGDGDDYAGLTQDGVATINGDDGEDYIQNIGAGSATLNGGKGRDRIFGNTSSDVINGGEGKDDIDGPAAIIVTGPDNDIVNFAVGEITGNAIITGSGADRLNLFGTPSNDMITVANTGGQVTVAVGTKTIAATGFADLLIDGGAGADTFVVNDLIGSELQTFAIDYGKSTSTNGTRILTETDDDGEEFRSIVPVLNVSNDGAGDFLTVIGSSNDDTFTLTAAGENDTLQSYTIVEVRRAGSVKIDLSSTVRSEGDRLTIDGKGGDDTIDAVGLGATTTNPSTGVEINATDQLAVTLIGGAGNDRLVGTPFDDVLNGGADNDTYTGGDGFDQFFDTDGYDTLVENQDLDMLITDSTFVTGSILGDGTIQILNRLDGFDRDEVQQITFTEISGSFRLSYKGATTDLISFNFTPSGNPALVNNTSADDIEAALLALSTVSNVRVTQESVGQNNIWEVAFLGATGQVVPGDASQSAAPVGNDSALSSSSVSGGSLGIVRVVKEAETVVETQRIVHSGAGGTFTLIYDDGTTTAETAAIAWDATALQLQNALNALSGDVAIGTVSVTNVPDQENNWLITFNASADRPQNVLLLRVGQNNLESGGVISSLPTEAELRETAKAVDPTVGIPDAFDRFASGAIVENLKNIFESARITGGLSRNLISVGSSTGVVTVGGNEPITVGSWTKEIIVDNRGLESGVLSEIYVAALSGEDGARISILDTGGGSGRDELKIFGTAKSDTVSASAFGQGGSRTGVLGFHIGDFTKSDVLFYRNVELVQIELGAGDDTILNDDTASTTLINTGDGDDEITIGTVPLIPDSGNRTLEFPEGVPVADVDNLTNGASNELYIYGQGENDRFEVNYNLAPLYLHGGSGDDRFLLKTFLVLRDNPADDQEVTNLANLFGGTGSNRYSYLENGPVTINGGPGIDTLVIVGTPVADTFVITETVVAGAGRLVSFRGIEAVEINGAGGGDNIYVLSTKAVTTTIVGGSGDDVIHFGGDHPPLVFDPPEISITPPEIKVESTPQLVYEKVEVRRSSEVFVFQTGWWGGWLSAFFPSINNYLQEVARAAVTNILQARFDASKGNNPNRRKESFSFDVNEPVTRRTGYSFFFGLFQRTEIVVTATNIVERFEEGSFQTTPTSIQPPSFRYDPPPFAFKQPGKFTVGDIRGRVIVEGGNSFESDGDTVIFHNSGGSNLSGLVTNREIPRMESLAGGVYQEALDSDGNAIVDVVVSVEGLGLGIPATSDPNRDGFLGLDGIRTYGVSLKGIETLDLRLADEAQELSPTASRDDRLIVALTDLRGADARAGVIGQVSDEDLQKIDLRIVAGAGDDIITLQQTTGQTEVFGGAGNDTVTLGQLGSLENIGGGIIFDGDAHIDEVQQSVPGSEIAGLDFPKVFTDLDNSAGTLALVGGGTLEFANRNLQPILFVENGVAQVRTISLRGDGEIRTAYVRDYGILAKNDKGQQLYVDALGKQTTDQFSNGERNQILWETNFLDPAAKALYVDSSGVKTDNPNPVIAFDRGGPEINVYRNPNSNVSFNNISLQYSADGDTWYDAGQVSSRRISQSVTNNDDSIDLADIGTYDFFRSGFAARFIRVVGDTGASDFRLDGIGVFPESAGKVQLIADKVFLDNVQSYVNSDGTTITTENASGETVNRGPSVAGVGDGLYAPVTPGDRVTYGASGVAIPSVVEVSRSEVIPFTRTVDVRITDPTTTGVDRLIVDGSANVSNLIGALDRYEIGVEKINLGGTINTYAGRVETVLANGSVVLDDGVAENYVAKTYFGGETVYRLINTAQQGLVGEEVINALRDPLDNFRLEALEYNGNEQVFDLFNGAVLFDPFSAELGRKAGDPIQHFQGNPVLHSVGEIQRYLGGEVARDENGKIVRNGDDSVFKRLPGQAIISDRRDVIYAPDFVDFTYTGDNQEIDLSIKSALNLKVNQGIDGWELDFSDRSITNNEFGGADRLISVVVSSERGIYALAPSEYSFNTTSDENSGVLTITGVDANKVSGDVSIRAHLAVTAFHREGDVVRYFGDENVQNGQP
ncbi:calcium-binding protein, partial [Akkermansiaceae bacterium]|nr:calcium-binding protein [Akkermansiaceae bacterium]